MHLYIKSLFCNFLTKWLGWSRKQTQIFCWALFSVLLRGGKNQNNAPKKRQNTTWNEIRCSSLLACAISSNIAVINLPQLWNLGKCRSDLLFTGYQGKSLWHHRSVSKGLETLWDGKMCPLGIILSAKIWHCFSISSALSGEIWSSHFAMMFEKHYWKGNSGENWSVLL